MSKIDEEGKRRSGLGRFPWMAVGTGLVFPGLSLFTSFPPPLFPATALISGALGLPTAYIAYGYRFEHFPGSRRRALPLLVFKALRLFAISVASIVCYLVLLDFCTVEARGVRFPIGFGTADWSLTERGRALKADDPAASAAELMLKDSAYSLEGVRRLWRTWAIYLSGITMVILFFMIVVTWVAGYSLLARHLHESLEEPSDGDAPA